MPASLRDVGDKLPPTQAHKAKEGSGKTRIIQTDHEQTSPFKESPQSEAKVFWAKPKAWEDRPESAT